MSEGESRKRIALSLNDDEIRDLETVSGVVRPSSWATIAVRKAIERAKSGAVYQELTLEEDSAVRILRELERSDPLGYEGLTGLIAWSAFSKPVRERVLQLAGEFQSRLEASSTLTFGSGPSKPSRRPKPRPKK